MNDNSKPRWFKRTWFVATVAGLLGIGVGAASMSTQDVTQTPEYQAVAAEQEDTASALSGKEQELAASQAEVAELQVKLTELQTKLTDVEGTIPAREQAVTTKEAQLKTREAAVTASEKDVRKREKAVGIIEREIEANTIPGDGIFQVGKDMKAGTYRTSGSSGCYYAVLSGLGGALSDIVDNNNIDGPAIVRLSSGRYFEVHNCAEWVLQR